MNNICLVLVEPQGPINVGSVCRSMMNFGLFELRLVSPCTDYRSLPAQKMALKAASILNGAAVYATLQEALADCHLSFGTTRRFGKYREAFLTPEEAAERSVSQPDDSRIAFVFGREDRGLHTDELDLCQFFITIPTHKAYPSMNLSQAATLMLYELRKAFLRFTNSKTEDTRLPACTKDVERMFQHMRATLLAVEYLDAQNPDHILRSFRRLFGRSGLDPREVRILQGLWSRIDWIDGERKKLLKNKDA
jgi:tRNA/rRNA methyltransferase